MANGRNPGRVKRDTRRDGIQFVALPYVVLDSPAYASLGYPARALLFDMARQLGTENNGRLLASRACLKKRGWTSNDVIGRALKQLIAEGLVFQTVKGHRPNKASWYAVTWYDLAKLKGYDEGAALLFPRGAYVNGAHLNPSDGHKRPPIAPQSGTEANPPAPANGTVLPILEAASTPCHGHHLDMPSVLAVSGTLREPVQLTRAHFRPFNIERLKGLDRLCYQWARAVQSYPRQNAKRKDAGINEISKGI